MKPSQRVTLLTLVAAIFFYLNVGTMPLMAGAVVGVSPSSVNFGTQATNGGVTSAPIRVDNTGDANLVISSVTVSGTNAADFSFTLVPTGYRPARTARGTATAPVAVPLTVAPGSSASVLINFKPTGAGSRSATLNISTSAGNPPAIPLSGSAANAGISISPTTLTFPSQLVGTNSTPQNVTVTNNGSVDLIITDVTTTGSNGTDYLSGATLTQQGRRGARGVKLVIPPQQSSTVSVAFSPTGSGPRNGTLNIIDNASGSPHTVALTGTAATPAGHLTLADTTLGFNTEKLITASVDNAPSSELTVTLTSSDASKLLLSTDTSGLTAGSASITAPIHALSNAIFPGFFIQALASSGTAQITVTAPNYTPAVANISFNPTGFTITGPNSTDTFSTSVGAGDSGLTLSISNLDTAGNIVVTNPPARLRAGISVTVPVNSSTPATGTITGGPATIAAGNTSYMGLAFHPVAAGTSTLTMGTPSLSGFAIPATETQITATVTQQAITMNPVNLGYNMQATGTAHLGAAAPGGGLQVTITSGDAAKVLLSTDATGQTVGSSSIILSVPAGQTSIPTFMIQSLSASGTVTLTASAPGYQSGTASVALTPSAFVIDGGKGIGQPFTSTPNSAVTIAVTLMRLDPSNAPVSAGPLRAGFSASEVDVTVGSSDENVGLVFGGGVFHTNDITDTANTVFFPQTLGQTTLSVSQPPGFGVPSSGATLAATVTSPTITVNTSVNRVGQNLQIGTFGSLNTPAGDNGLTVTFTSNNANVLVSSDPAAAGSSSTSVFVPAGKGLNGIGFPTVYVQALAGATGTATITASTSDGSFASGNKTVTVAPSAFVISSPNGLGADFATIHSTAGNPTNPTTLSVMSYALNGSLAETMEPVRGGLSVSVAVSSSSTPIGTINNSPVLFTGGVSGGQVSFQPGTTVGVATITVAQPSGFSTNAASSLKANVN